MSIPRTAYRAHVAVIPLDPKAESFLLNVRDPEELSVLSLDNEEVGQTSSTSPDILLFLCGDAAAVSADQIIIVAQAARTSGMLVGGAIIGSVAEGQPGNVDERAGLAGLREAVDMLVVVRDDSLAVELLDVLRGGRTPRTSSVSSS